MMTERLETALNLTRNQEKQEKLATPFRAGEAVATGLISCQFLKISHSRRRFSAAWSRQVGMETV
jgi:hypothetical protein